MLTKEAKEHELIGHVLKYAKQYEVLLPDFAIAISSFQCDKGGDSWFVCFYCRVCVEVVVRSYISFDRRRCCKLSRLVGVARLEKAL